jgi:hypothetical protein
MASSRARRAPGRTRYLSPVFSPGFVTGAVKSTVKAASSTWNGERPVISPIVERTPGGGSSPPARSWAPQLTSNPATLGAARDRGRWTSIHECFRLCGPSRSILPTRHRSRWCNSTEKSVSGESAFILIASTSPATGRGRHRRRPSYCSKGKGAPTLARLGDEERGSGTTSIAPDLALSSSSERHLRFTGCQDRLPSHPKAPEWSCHPIAD